MSIVGGMMKALGDRPSTTDEKLDTTIEQSKARIEQVKDQTPGRIQDKVEDGTNKFRPLKSAIDLLLKFESGGMAMGSELTQLFQGITGGMYAKAIPKLSNISPEIANESFLDFSKQISKNDPTPNKIDPLAAWVRGFTGEQETRGRDVIEQWDLNNRLPDWLKGATGFALEVLNPLDPVNWIDFGQVSDSFKIVGREGSEIFVKTFGKSADEIMEITKKAMTKHIDNITSKTGGKVVKNTDVMTKTSKKLFKNADELAQATESTVGKFIDNISKIAREANLPLTEQRKLSKLMAIGVSETGLDASYRLPVWKARSLKIRLDTPLAPLRELTRGIGNLGVWGLRKNKIRLLKKAGTEVTQSLLKPYIKAADNVTFRYLAKVGIDSGYVGKAVTVAASGVYQTTRLGLNKIHNAMIKVPGLGKVLTGGGDMMGRTWKALGRAFSTTALPKEMPTSILVKDLYAQRTKAVRQMVTDGIFKPEEVQTILDELPTINWGAHAQVGIDGPSTIRGDVFAYKNEVAGDFVNLRAIGDATQIDPQTVQQILMTENILGKDTRSIMDMIQTIEGGSKQIAATKAVKIRKIIDDMYAQIPDALKGYFKGTITMAGKETNVLMAALENINRTDFDSPLLSMVFRHKGIDIYVPLANLNQTATTKWTQTVGIINALDNLPAGHMAALEKHIVQSPVFLQGDAGKRIGGAVDNGIVILADQKIQTVQHEFAHVWDIDRGVTVKGGEFEQAALADADVINLDRRITKDFIQEDGGGRIAYGDPDLDLKEDFAIGTQRAEADKLGILDEAPARAAVILQELELARSDNFLKALADDDILQANRFRAFRKFTPIEDQFRDLKRLIDRDIFDPETFNFEDAEKVWNRIKDKMIDLMDKESTQSMDVIAQVNELFKGTTKAERSLVTDIMSEFDSAEINKFAAEGDWTDPKAMDEIYKQRKEFAARYDAMSDKAKRSLDNYFKWRDSFIKQMNKQELSVTALEAIRDDLPKHVQDLRARLLKEVPQKEHKIVTELFDNFTDSEISRYTQNTLKSQYKYVFKNHEFYNSVQEAVTAKPWPGSKNRGIPQGMMRSDELIPWLRKQNGIGERHIEFFEIKKWIQDIQGKYVSQTDLTDFLERPYGINMDVIDDAANLGPSKPGMTSYSSETGNHGYTHRPTTATGDNPMTGKGAYKEFTFYYDPVDVGKGSLPLRYEDGISSAHLTSRYKHKNEMSWIRGFETRHQGKRVFMIEEMQSDWFQKAQSYGFNDPNVMSNLRNDGTMDRVSTAMKDNMKLELGKYKMAGAGEYYGFSPSDLDRQLQYVADELAIAFTESYRMTGTSLGDFMEKWPNQRKNYEGLTDYVGSFIDKQLHHMNKLSNPGVQDVLQDLSEGLSKGVFDRNLDEIVDQIAILTDQKILQNIKYHMVELPPYSPLASKWEEISLRRITAWAQEQGFERIGIYGSDLQVDRWSRDYEKAYQNLYDDKAPAILRKSTGAKKRKIVDDGQMIGRLRLGDLEEHAVLNYDKVRAIMIDEWRMDYHTFPEYMDEIAEDIMRLPDYFDDALNTEIIQNKFKRMSMVIDDLEHELEGMMSQKEIDEFVGTLFGFNQGNLQSVYDVEHWKFEQLAEIMRESIDIDRYILTPQMNFGQLGDVKKLADDYVDDTYLNTASFFDLENTPTKQPMFSQTEYQNERVKFVDTALESIKNKMPNKMKAGEIVPWLLKQPGVRMDETIAYGVGEFLEVNRGLDTVVTKDELLELFQAEEMGVSFYIRESGAGFENRLVFPEWSLASPEDYKEMTMTYSGYRLDEDTSPHFGKDRPGTYMAHSRGFEDTINGKRTWVIEEMQSDSASRQRIFGYKGKALKPKLYTRLTDHFSKYMTTEAVENIGALKLNMPSVIDSTPIGLDDDIINHVVDRATVELKRSIEQMLERGSDHYMALFNNHNRKLAPRWIDNAFTISFNEILMDSNEHFLPEHAPQLLKKIKETWAKESLQELEPIFKSFQMQRQPVGKWEENMMKRVVAWAKEQGYTQIATVKGKIPFDIYEGGGNFNKLYDEIIPQKAKKLGLQHIDVDFDGTYDLSAKRTWMSMGGKGDQVAYQTSRRLYDEPTTAQLYNQLRTVYDEWTNAGKVLRDYKTGLPYLNRVIDHTYKMAMGLTDDITEVGSFLMTDLFRANDSNFDEFLSFMKQKLDTPAADWLFTKVDVSIPNRAPMKSVNVPSQTAQAYRGETVFPEYTELYERTKLAPKHLGPYLDDINLWNIDGFSDQQTLFRYMEDSGSRADDFKYKFGQLSPQGQQATLGMNQWRQKVASNYAEAGIPMDTMEKYFPFIPQGVLRKSEKEMLQGIYGAVPKSAEPTDPMRAVLEKTDPNLKARQTKAKNPKEINKLLGRKWLTEDAAYAMATRGIRAVTALQVNEFMVEFMGEYGIEAGEMAKLVLGKVIPENYAAYTKHVMDNGQIVFRQLAKVEAGADAVVYLPKAMVDTVNTYLETMLNTHSKNQILKQFDKVTSIYKKIAYLWNPGHIPRDFIGNVWNGHLMGVNTPLPYIEAANTMMAPSKIKKMVNFNGEQVEWTGEHILKYGHEHGILDVGFYASDTPEKMVESLGKVNKNPLRKGGYSHIMRKGTQVSDTFTRLAGFMDALNKGATVEQAAAGVKKFYFDYFDLTPTEKKFMKRIIPFYTWMRKNIPLQLEQLLKQPKLYRNIQLARRAFDEEIDEAKVPGWIDDSMAFKIGDKFIAPNMPYGDLNRLGFDWESFRQLIGSVNPIIRMPLEMALNSQFFTGQKIADYEGERQPLPFAGAIDALGGEREDVPTVQKRGLGYLLQQMPMLNNLSIMTDPENPRAGSRASTMLGGPAVYDAENVETSAKYEDMAKLRDIIRLLKDMGIDVPDFSDIEKKSSRFGAF